MSESHTSTSSAGHHGAERTARRRLLEHGADAFPGRPWQPPALPVSDGDLVRYALWKSAELDAAELVGALSLVPAARAEAEGAELGLVFAARSAGVTWAKIASATGFRSPQACQQFFTRMSIRQETGLQ